MWVPCERCWLRVPGSRRWRARRPGLLPLLWWVPEFTPTKWDLSPTWGCRFWPTRFPKGAGFGGRGRCGGDWVGSEGKGAFFDNDGLGRWLEGILGDRVARAGLEGSDSSGRVTFGDLFSATGIELDVVVADISVGRQAVFNARWTPNVSVCSAVLASAAIPGAFPHGDLWVPTHDAPNGLTVHTLVDGGVWSNFPMFVFDDEAFRYWMDRQVASKAARAGALIDPPPYDFVVGFVLEEATAGRAVDYGDSRFVPVGERSGQITPREWLDSPPRSQGESPRQRRLIRNVLSWLMLEPIRAARSALVWSSDLHRSRWPTPRNKFLGAVLAIFDGSSAAFGRRTSSLLGMVLYGVATFFGVRAAYGYVMNWIDVNGLLDWSTPLLILLMASVVMGYVLLALAVLTFLFINPYLARTARTMGYGLAKTYFAGPGAPPWTGERPNVVSLPIPAEVTTLSFRMSPTVKKRLIAEAERVTAARLAHIMEGDGAG